MEKVPVPGTEISISTYLAENLIPQETKKYKEIKAALQALLPPEIWQEFSLWMDENLKALGMIGKSLESMGKLKKERKTAQNKKLIAHSDSIFRKAWEKTLNAPVGFINWVDQAPATSLEQVGELLDIASPFYINADVNKKIKDGTLFPK